MIHESIFEVRTFHCDSFGHVNNARHFEFLEEARWRFGDSIGLAKLLRKAEIGFIIFDLRIRFREPVTEDQTLRVESRLAALGTNSGELEQTAYVCGATKPAVKAKLQFLLVDRANQNKPVDISGEILECLKNAMAQ